MKIPDKIKIVGRDIKVVWVPDLVQQDDIVGQAAFRYDTIRLQSNNAGLIKTPQSLALSLLHEILHWAFFLMHEDKQNKDEALVSRLSEVLYQVLHDNQLRF